MPWVGSLPCNVRALDSVNSLESLFGTRAILMRMYEEAGKAGEGSQSSCPCAEQRLLGVEAILHAPQWQEGEALVSQWVHALVLSCKLQGLQRP